MLEMGIKMHVDDHVKCLLLLSDFNQNWTVSTNSSKTTCTEFKENLSNSCWVIICGQRDGHGKAKSVFLHLLF
jgi:hypothetical protein